MESKEHTADGHDGSNAAAACFITCVDLKDVANHSLDKWTRLDFPMLLFSTPPPPTVNENLFAGHWWVVGRHTYLCLAKEEKKRRNETCKLLKICYVEFQKLVRILNGVCCAIVHLHCSCQNQLLLKNLTSAKTRLACCFYFYFFYRLCAYFCLVLQSHFRDCKAVKRWKRQFGWALNRPTGLNQ